PGMMMERMITELMTMRAMTVAVMVGNRRASIQLPYQNNFSPASCHRGVGTVFLIASRLRRVRLVVRTQPSQGWYTGSTPVRAAMPTTRTRNCFHHRFITNPLQQVGVERLNGIAD